MVSEAIPWLWHDIRLTWKILYPSSHATVNVPNAEHIIISPARQLLTIRTPLESANLLPMRWESADNTLISRCSNVIIMDLRIKRATWKQVLTCRVPREWTKPAIMMVFKCFDLCKLISVPKMQLLAWCAYGKHWAIPLHPCNGCHNVVVIFSIKKLFDITCVRVPKIHCLSQTYCQDIVRAPVKQVEIVIVYDVRRVQNFLRELRYATDAFLLMISFLLC